METKKVTWEDFSGAISTPFMTPRSKDLIKHACAGNVKGYADVLRKYTWRGTRDYTMVLVFLSIIALARNTTDPTIKALLKDIKVSEIKVLLDYILKAEGQAIKIYMRSDRLEGYKNIFLTVLKEYGSQSDEAAAKIWGSFVEQLGKITSWKKNGEYIEKELKPLIGEMMPQVRGVMQKEEPKKEEHKESDAEYLKRKLSESDVARKILDEWKVDWKAEAQAFVDDLYDVMNDMKDSDPEKLWTLFLEVKKYAHGIAANLEKEIGIKKPEESKKEEPKKEEQVLAEKDSNDAKDFVYANWNVETKTHPLFEKIRDAISGLAPGSNICRVMGFMDKRDLKAMTDKGFLDICRSRALQDKNAASFVRFLKLVYKEFGVPFPERKLPGEILKGKLEKPVDNKKSKTTEDINKNAKKEDIDKLHGEFKKLKAKQDNLKQPKKEEPKKPASESFPDVKTQAGRKALYNMIQSDDELKDWWDPMEEKGNIADFKDGDEGKFNEWKKNELEKFYKGKDTKEARMDHWKKEYKAKTEYKQNEFAKIVLQASGDWDESLVK